MTGVDSEHLAWLLVVDALSLVGGAGALAAIGFVRSLAELAIRGGVALLAGLLIGGIVEAHLALVGVPISLGVLTAIVLVLALSGSYRWRRSARPPDARLPRRASALLAPLALVVATIELAHVAATAAVRPMLEWDSWAIWSPKAHELTVAGSANASFFANRAYEGIHLDYPILQPTVEALAMRGGWDPGMAHLQLVVLVGSALWALIGLFHGRVPLEVPSLAVAFLALQPWFVKGLLSGYADVPVAMVTACALVALVRFALDGDRRLLAIGALFAAGAGLIKNEGTLFVLAAFAAAAIALVVARRPRELRPLGLGLLAVLLIWAPWRLYVALHNLPSTDFHLVDAFDPNHLGNQFGRVQPATSALWGQVGLVAPTALLVVGLIAAVVARRFALAIAIASWCALTFAGLIGIYWISILPIHAQLAESVDRVATTLLVGGVVLGAFGAGEALRAHALSKAIPRHVRRGAKGLRVGV